MQELEEWKKQAEVRYIGSYEAMLDGKGFFCLPPEFTQTLESHTQIPDTLVFLYVDALYIYAFNDYMFLSEYALNHMRCGGNIEDLPYEMSLMHEGLSVHWANSGAVQIPECFMRRAHLRPQDNLMVIGMGNHIEVWEQRDWEGIGNMLDKTISKDSIVKMMRDLDQQEPYGNE